MRIIAHVAHQHREDRTCCANDCDVIFISKELGEHIKDRAKVPVIELDNFMNKVEVEEKTLAYLDSVR